MKLRIALLMVVGLLLVPGCKHEKPPVLPMFIASNASDVNDVADRLEKGERSPLLGTELDPALVTVLSEQADGILRALTACDYRADPSLIGTSIVPYLIDHRKDEYLHQGGQGAFRDWVVRNKLVIEVDSVDVQSMVVNRGVYALVQGEAKVTVVEAAWVDPNGPKPGEHAFRFRVHLYKSGDEWLGGTWLAEFIIRGEWK